MISRLDSLQIRIEWLKFVFFAALLVMAGCGDAREGGVVAPGEGTVSTEALINETGFDFSMGVTPSALSVAQGSSATATLQTHLLSGSPATLLVGLSGVPTGATASVSPTTMTTGAGALVTIDAGTAAPGDYQVTVTGTAASGARSVTLALSIVAPDFALAVAPTVLIVSQGHAGTAIVSTAGIAGTSETIFLSDSGLPAGATAQFSIPSVPAGGTALFTFNAGSTTALGLYSIAITGSASSGAHTSALLVDVVGPEVADFAIASAPSTLNLQRGASTTALISTTATGAPGTVYLSVSGAPAGMSAAILGSVAAGGSTQLYLTIGGSVAPGNYSLTVTGVEGPHTHSTTVLVSVYIRRSSGL